MPFGMPEYQGPGAVGGQPPPAAPVLSTDQSQSGGQAPQAAPSGNAPAGAAPSGSAPAGQQVSGQSGTQTPAQLVDLDKYEKFLWKGKEVTRKEWEEGQLRQSDYTRKTQELTHRQRFVDNFSADLGKVLNDPDKWWSQFERTYPQDFVEQAKAILEYRKSVGSPTQQQQSANPQEKGFSVKDDPEFQALRSELDEWKRANQEAQTEASRQWLASQHEIHSKKFPYAHKEIVEARLGAHAMKYGGKSVDAKLMGEVYKQVNEELQERAAKLTKTVINKQIEAGKGARDVGSGGDVPAAKPHEYKTMKEAREAMLRDIDASRSR